MAKLTIIFSSSPTRVHHVGKQTVLIGRAPNAEVWIDDPSVSGSHAQLVYCAGIYTLTDLRSTNGTKVNGHFIKTHVLRDSDRIRFGHVTCIFELPSSFLPSKHQTKCLLRVSRDGKCLGYFTPENAREGLKRGELKKTDQVWHDPG